MKKEPVDISANLNAINDELGAVLSGFGNALKKENPLSDVYLDESQYNKLYEKARVFQNMVNLIPEDANLEYPVVHTTKKLNTELIQQELQAVKAKGEPLEQLDLKGAVTLCGVYARLYGDGFIFMGIRDGREASEPVDWENVQGIDWVVVRSKYEVSLYPQREQIVNYGSGVLASDLVQEDENIRGVSFHSSRVFRMVGVSRHGTSLQRDQYNSSVIDGVYSDYVRYLRAIKSGSDMLESHSTFKFGISGLSAKALKSSVVSGLRTRFQNILDGIRIIGGVMYDKETENAEYITRSYSGVKDILEHLKSWLVGNSGLPQNKLFGSAASNSLSNQSQGEKEQWAEIIDRYRANQVIAFYDIILKAILISKGIDENDAYVEFRAFYQRTEKEIAETNKLENEAFKTLVDTLTSAVEAGLIDDTQAKEKLADYL